MNSFNGTLNSKSVYGQSYSSSECLRSMKLGRLLERSAINDLTCKWHKRDRGMYPSWATSLYNYPGDRTTFTQRHDNVFYRKTVRKPRLQLFRWKMRKNVLAYKFNKA